MEEDGEERGWRKTGITRGGGERTSGGGGWRTAGIGDRGREEESACGGRGDRREDEFKEDRERHKLSDGIN